MRAPEGRNENMQGQETTTALKPTRASFIRGLPVDMPVQEVIERGREVGLEIQPSDIHAARYYMRQQGGGAEAPVNGAAGNKPVGNGTNGHASNGKSVLSPTLLHDAAKRGSEKEIKHAGVQLITSRPVEAHGAGATTANGSSGAQAITANGVKGASAVVAKPANKGGRGKLYMPEPTGTPEEQLRLMIRRLGTKRTRSILEEMEAGFRLAMKRK